MLEQVSGRAGRAHKQGQVIIQTSQPDHDVIKFVQAHDYEGFYQHELADRQQFGYPRSPRSSISTSSIAKTPPWAN